MKAAEDQAVKERKEAETRKNAEELHQFLGFSDIDWNNVQPTDFQSINFSTQEDEQCPTLEQLALMEQCIFAEYSQRVRSLRDTFKRTTTKTSSRSKRRQMIDRAVM